MLSASRELSDSSKLSGIDLILFLSFSLRSKTFILKGPYPILVGSIFLFIPSKPAITIAGKAKNGLQVPSGVLNSNLKSSSELAYFGILIAAERLPIEKKSFVGASNPGTSLLKELTDGFVKAQRDLP